MVGTLLLQISGRGLIRCGRLILLGVPTISRVYGMTIRMFFKEPGDPQFDARYGGRASEGCRGAARVGGGRAGET